MQKLEPNFCMLFFIFCRFFKQRTDLHIAVFFCLGGIVKIFGVRLGFACECRE